MINKLENSKKIRINKFLSYIDDISNKKNISQKKIIENNLKCFNFNLKSGLNLMHPLHFAVQANNIKAIEKFKKVQESENIDFFSRDGENHDMPQEYSAPTSPIYKIVFKI